MFKIICIGSCIVDYIGFVSNEWITKARVEKGGVLSVTPSKWKELINGLGQMIERAGGSAGTVVKGLGQLGITSAFLSRYGSDLQSTFFRSILKNNHVSLFGPVMPGNTAKVMCAITSDGQRSFLFCPAGDNGTPSPIDLDETLFQQTEWLHIEGYTVRNKPFLEKVLYLAQKYKLRTSFDLGAFVIVRENRNYLINSVLNKIDLLFGNADEMRELGLNNLKLLPPLSVALQGGFGCTLYSNGNEFVFPTTKVEPVDTLGAGDLFISGFLFGMIKNWPLDKCAEFANHIGGTIVTQIGAELPLQIWNEIKNEFLLQKKL